MAMLAKKIENEVGITVSIGLSFNKFLAKLASELDKPRGFAVIGRAEAVTFLRDKPVGFIRGAGAALQARLAKDGITHIAQLQDLEPEGTGASATATPVFGCTACRTRKTRAPSSPTAR